MRRRFTTLAVTVASLSVMLIAGADAASTIAFRAPVFVTHDATEQAGEPSIRVDATGPKQRIWVAAPTGIGVNSRSLPAGGGDLFWYSDDDGKTFTTVLGATIVGGGDSDVATGFGAQVYGTGLTLANNTVSASCDNGATWQTNPVSHVGAIEDRQWIDTWEDHAKPSSNAPDLMLTFGNIAAGRIVAHQVFSPSCTPPVGGAVLDASGPDCPPEGGPGCYQWPGNLAIDETTGDVYVTHNTLGNDEAPFQDDVIVARIAGGANGLVDQSAVTSVVAANDRPDTFDSFTVVAVDTAGNVYVVWSERHPEAQRTDVMFASSRDHGAHWSKPRRVNKVNTTTFPWIVAGDPGRVDIVYYGTESKGPSPETVPQSSRWKVYMAQSIDALAAKPTFVEKAATPYMHRGSVCTSGTGCASGTRDLLDFFQVDVDAQGWANIAYTDNLNTPADGSDPHQEWIAFVQQSAGPRLYT
jgi:hypothetical protein